MKNFLLEIGLEELPPFLVKKGEEILKIDFLKFLEENLIEFSNIKTFSTPRRWAVRANLSDKQKQIEEVITGPPKKFGIDEKGEFLPAAIKFAESKGVSKNELFVVQKGKGEYIAVKIKKGGLPTRDVLSENLPEFIKSLKFPLMMNWGRSFLFPRPIKWILCLMDKKIINFKVDGIKSGKKTKGNRLKGNEWIRVNDEKDYEELLKENFVLPDFEQRKSLILKKAKNLVKKKKGVLFYDDELLEEVTGLVEYPGVVMGEFPEKYLEMPRDFVVTAMRVHQRYFAVEDREGNLLPYFIAVINNTEDKYEKIVEGLEKVLIARLEDAEFYMMEDLKIPLEKRIDSLKELYWDEELGTVYDKIYRIDRFFEVINLPDELHRESIKRAIFLSRTDLTTEMIKDGKEFTLLEGVVASEYAKRQGEDERVVKILREFLKPRAIGDSMPELKESAILGLIDRWDSFIGYFLKGYRPTGSKDPLGMRKIIYGFFDLLIHFKFRFSLKEWSEKMMDIYQRENNKEQILDYIFKRYDRYLEEKKGIRYDIVDSIIASDDDDLYRIYLKAYWLEEYYKKERRTFLGVVVGQKRVANILRNEKTASFINVTLFKEEEEKKLYSKVEELRDEYLKSLSEEKFEKSIAYLFMLKPYIDRFFDNVFVMTENIEIRKNRLALLESVKELFDKYADFSKIVVSNKEIEEIQGGKG